MTSPQFQPNARRRRFALLLALLLVAVAAGPTTAQDEPEEPPPARVLVYSGTQSFRHDSIDHGNPILSEVAAEAGTFTVDHTEDPADLTLATLSQYDIVLWNSPSGESVDGVGVQPAQTCLHDAVDSYACTSAPFTQQQREEFIAWSQCGGGFVGIHMALDAWHDWAEWDELTGWIHLNHFAAGEAEVFVEAADPIAAPFGPAGSSFLLSEEYYTTLEGDGPQGTPQFTKLLGIGAFTDPVIEAAQGQLFADHGPIAWTSSFRDANRTFITNLGHSNATWDLPAYREHLVAGIEHVAEVRPDPVCVSAIEIDPPAPPALPVTAAGQVLSPPAADIGGELSFQPRSLTLPQASTLDYTSLDPLVPHQIVSLTPGLFRSGLVNFGDTSPVEGVSDLPPGTYEYFCGLHPVMTGTLTIV